MSRLVSSFLLAFLFSFSALAQATVSERLNALFAEYNLRFTTGKFVSNPTLAERFLALQEKTFTDLLATGDLTEVLVVQNDADPNLVIRLYALQDENKNLVAFYYNKSSYFDREEQSYLRFRVLADVVKGLGFVNLNGQHAVTITGHHLKPNESGTLQFSYLTNFRQQQRGVLNLFIIKKQNRWSLYNEKYSPVSKLFVKTWKNLFPPNGGVTELILQ